MKLNEKKNKGKLTRGLISRERSKATKYRKMREKKITGTQLKAKRLGRHWTSEANLKY